MSETQESDKAFLTRHQVPGMLKELLRRLGNQQPSDPLAVMAEHFSISDGRRAEVQEARECLQQQPFRSPAFLFCVKEAFDCLRRVQREQNRLLSVCGTHYTQLLELLLSDTAGGSLLLQRLRARPQAAIQFGKFYSSILTVFVFKSFVAESCVMFNEAQTLATGKGNRQICAALLQLLESALQAPGIFAGVDGVSATSVHEAATRAKAKARLPTIVQQQDFATDAAAVFIRRLL